MRATSFDWIGVMLLVLFALTMFGFLSVVFRGASSQPAGPVYYICAVPVPIVQSRTPEEYQAEAKLRVDLMQDCTRLVGNK